MKIFGLFSVALANPDRLEKLKGHRDVFIQLAGNNTDMNDFTKSRVTNFLDDLVDQAENASVNCTSSAEDERLFEEEAPRAFSSDDVCQLTNDLAKALRSFARRFTCKESAPKKLFEEKYLKRCKRFEKIVARKAFCGLGM